MKSPIKISEAESVVMKVIWRKNPISANEVIETLEGTTDWNPRTIRTLINRLAEKGAVKHEKRGRAFFYTPTFNESDYLEFESESFLERFFGGALNPMVSHLLDAGKIGPKEFEELKRLFSSKGNRPRK